ncbi:MAG: hypothetical protein E7070_10655 [Bacteroidales bacterium]|jgi:hypothetical protein|nr:hypothetical protein [Bacteroidales bacterium]
MIFPGLKKLGKQLGFKNNGIFFYGYLQNCFISFADGQGLKLLCIRTPVALDEEDKKKIKSWEKKGYASQVSFPEVSAQQITITFLEKFLPFKVAKIKEIIEDIVGYIAAKYPNAEIKCSTCQNAATSDPEMGIYEIDGVPTPLCRACASKRQKEIDEAKEELENQPDNYIQGIGTAAAFSIPGILASILFFALGKIAAVSGLIYLFLALKGYTWANGKLNKTGLLIVSAISLFFSALGTWIAYVIYVASELAKTPEFSADSFGDRIFAAFSLIEIPELHEELNKNIAITLIICGICIVLQMRQTWKSVSRARIKKLD